MLATYAAGGEPLSVALLVDTTGSPVACPVEAHAAAVEFFERPLAAGESVSLVRFDTKIKVLQDFTHSAALLRAAVAELPKFPRPDPELSQPVRYRSGANATRGVWWYGRTRLYDAVYQAARSLQNRPGRRAIIVVTDWQDTASRAGLEAVLQAARESDSAIYPIRCTYNSTLIARRKPASDEERIKAVMRKAADDTGGRALEVNADHSLSSRLEQVRLELRLPKVVRRPANPSETSELTFSATATAPTPDFAARLLGGFFRGTISFASPASAKYRACPLFFPPRSDLELQLGLIETLRPLPEDRALGGPGPDRFDDREAAQIVEKVAATYRAARSIVLQGVWEFRQAGAQGRTDISIAFEPPGRVRLKLASKANRLRGTPAEFTSAYEFVADGRAEWLHVPSEHVFSKSASSGRAEQVRQATVGRYADLASYPTDLHVAGRGTLPGPGGQVRYVVLRGHGPYGGLIQEYWVDESRRIILGEHLRDWRDGVAATLSWQHQELNSELPAATFAFTPPKGATEVARLASPELRCTSSIDRVQARSAGPESSFIDFTLPDQRGELVRFSDLRGKVVLLAFWNTWCPLSARQLKDIVKLQKKHEERGLVVLGVASEPAEIVEAFLERNGLGLRTLIDPEYQLLAPARGSVSPVTVVVSRDGRTTITCAGARPAANLAAALHRAGL